MPTARRVAVIGGGLAGLLVAIRLEREGIAPILIEDPLPAASGLLGGFAKFSGAKFSLPPAGMGLSQLVGSNEQLDTTISKVLAVLGLYVGTESPSMDVQVAELDSSTISYRRYNSIVLSPLEVDSLIKRLTNQLTSTRHIAGQCVALTERERVWNLTIRNADGPDLSEITAETVFYAGGRRGGDLLATAGALPQDGRGLDLGVRLDFSNKTALSGLRSLGPDAKLLMNECRTFCLNLPGDVYRYESQDLSIPGGVVSSENGLRANVGILYRDSAKSKLLSGIKRGFANLRHQYPDLSVPAANFLTVEDLGPLNLIYPKYVIRSIARFAAELTNLQLIDWRVPYLIHFPLLDWHWPVYATSNTFRTTLRRVYVAGDSAGYARGLLQAATTGWLAAEEYLNDISKE